MKSQFELDVIEGLNEPRKRISSKYLYDSEGSELFKKICELPEYYPTRTELQVLEQIGPELEKLTEGLSTLIEPGCGEGKKTRLLLRYLPSLKTVLPVEICAKTLSATHQKLSAEFPDRRFIPIISDFTRPIELPRSLDPNRLIFFPGSTLGNFSPSEASSFLRTLRSLAGFHGGILLGVDLRKEPEILEAAYDDSAGVTSAFNLNLLVRMNRELGADFDIENFEHLAVYNTDEHRIEMHLRSLKNQEVNLSDRRFYFSEGETIHTENSYKHSRESLSVLAQSAGIKIKKFWTDSNSRFAVVYCEPASFSS